MQRMRSILCVTGFVALISTPALVQIAVEIARGQRPPVLDVLTRWPTKDNLQTYETRLEEASIVRETWRPAVQYLQFRLLHSWGRQVMAGRDGWLFYRPGIESLTQRSSQNPARDGDPLTAIVSFRNQLARRGIHLLVVPMPNKESSYPEQLTRHAAATGGIVARPTRELLTQLSAAGVDHVDVFQLFRQAKQDESPGAASKLYLVQDTHWSPAGAQLAAQAVADHLLAHARIDRGQTEYKRQPVSVKRLGDLVEMQHVPAIERHVGPETVDGVQIVDSTSGSLYADEPASQILVLGDSFLRIFQQDEPGAAGFIAHLAAQLQQPVASIVNDGGASTLVRQQLARRPQLLAGKKVVVWEFVERDIRQGTEGWQEVGVLSTEY